MSRPRGRGRPDQGGADRGSALVEFVGAAVVLLLPLVYLLLTVFALQRASFGVDEAAREAGRALTTAGSTAAGLQEATYAAQLAMQDQGFSTPPQVRYTAGGAGCGAAAPSVLPILTPGASYDVCVSIPVALPFTGNRLLGSIAPAAITVVGRYRLVVDAFRAAR
ncbi:MAG: hypothetical protein ACYDB7_05055 [Mycobacteriales bacterium]